MSKYAAQRWPQVSQQGPKMAEGVPKAPEHKTVDPIDKQGRQPKHFELTKVAGQDDNRMLCRQRGIRAGKTVTKASKQAEKLKLPLQSRQISD